MKIQASFFIFFFFLTISIYGQPDFYVTVKDNGNNTQTVTYIWKSTIVPANCPANSIDFREYPNGQYPPGTGNSNSSNTSPRTLIMTKGTYEYRLRFWISNGNGGYTLNAGYVFSVSNGNETSVQTLPPPSYNIISKLNFIKTYTPIKPLEGGVYQQNYVDVKEFVQYFDGLGRPLQTVVKKGSLVTNSLNPLDTTAASDLVSTTLYDEFGREQYKYLPFAANNAGDNTSINDGLFKTNPYQQQQQFMQQKYGSQQESNFYSQTVFEASPLNRVLETYAPGASWAGSSTQATEANRHGIKTKYWINTNNDSVRIWDVADATQPPLWGNYITTRAYPAGELYKNVTVDEHNKQVIEFKDKEGKVVLKKVQLTAPNDNGEESAVNTAHTGWMCTYYIYDDLGNLRCVIQPEGVKAMNQSSNWNLSSQMTLLAEQCFRYEYDGRNRMIMKQVPGAKPVYMVYDQRDRLVMTQDGNQRTQNNWLFTQYDILNRPIATGLIADARNFDIILADAYNRTDYPLLQAGTIKLTETFYDDYSWLDSTRHQTVINGKINADYDGSYNTYLQTPSNNAFPYAQENIKDSRTKGMVTGTKVTELNTTTNVMYTLTIYDAKARPIQVKSINHTGGTDIATTQYSWSGQPLVMVTRQQKIAGGSASITTITKNSYDALGRVVQTTKNVIDNISNITSGERTIAQNEYDELGQLKNKKLGLNNGAPVETQNYEYNIRGWLLGVNRDYVAGQIPPSGGGGAKFGFDLAYDKTNNLTSSAGYQTAMYNGNITGMTWRGKQNGAGVKRYDFAYDNANRILNADFKEVNGTTITPTGAFNSRMGVNNNPETAYDYNGNILSMTQNGLYNNSVQTIDQLAYTYIPGTNKLLKVRDQQTTKYDLGDFYDGDKPDTDDYEYDHNGNLTKDGNKNIQTITYNQLNLPQVITVAGKGTITYTYDVAGNKLSKLVNENGNQKTTLYLGGMVFENNNLQFIGMEEGRMRLEANSWKYDYFLKDHLGNVRMMLAENGEVLEETHYYPFGLQMKGISYTNACVTPNKYKYNGKEEQSELGLDWMDYGARMYDNQIGRFFTQDRFADKYQTLTPYQYGANNPISIIDVNGDSIWIVIKSNITDANGNRSIKEDKYYYGQDKNGTYGFLDGSGAIYSGSETFVGDATTAIDKIRTGGNVGKTLVNDLMASTNSTELVKRSSNAASIKGDYITWNPTGTSSAPDTKGSTTRPAFIGLAHEMAHVRDTWNGTKNTNTWQTVTDANGNTITIQNAELYSTHIENQIRSENKLPLRAYYGVDTNGNGEPSTRLIKAGTQQSLYYNPNGTTNYQQLGPKQPAFTY